MRLLVIGLATAVALLKTVDTQPTKRLSVSLQLLVLRRIQPRLPSFSEQFTQSVPLTRIRDIAHRNDIPHDLKVRMSLGGEEIGSMNH